MSQANQHQPGGPADSRTPRQKLIDNERARLTAQALNNSAVAAFAAGVVGPVASDLYGIAAPKSPILVGFGLCCIAGSALLHLSARWTLGGRRP